MNLVDSSAWLEYFAGGALAGVANKLPLADSVILATARLHEATIWTLDADSKGIAGVRYFAREK